MRHCNFWIHCAREVDVRQQILKVILGAGVLLLGACATRGKDFPSNLTWIKTNTTTQKDVSQLLGQPYQVGNSAGTGTWTYGYYKFRLIGASNTKELKFWWNPDQTVKYYSFSSSFPADKNKAVAPPDTPPPQNFQEYPIN